MVCPLVSESLDLSPDKVLFDLISDYTVLHQLLSSFARNVNYTSTHILGSLNNLIPDQRVLLGQTLTTTLALYYRPMNCDRPRPRIETAEFQANVITL